MKQPFIHLLKSIFDTLFPRYCCVCGKRLAQGEEHTCIHCMLSLPRTYIKGKKNNIIERLMWDHEIYTQRASSFMYYYQKSPFCNIFFNFKYFNHPEIAVYYGRIMADELRNTGFFEGIDCLIPIPLATKRFKQRGYNQSERLAHGISLVTNIPVDTLSVIRCVDNPSQTHLITEERINNVNNIFSLVDPDKLKGKHVLIVDDMITTGSTTRACAHALLKAPDVKISVISLGTSCHNRRTRFSDELFDEELELQNLYTY